MKSRAWSVVAACLLATSLTGCANAPLLGVAATASAASPAGRSATLAALQKVDPLSDEAFAALTDAQFAALSASQVAAITAKQFASLSPARCYTLMVSQFTNLSPAQLHALTPAWLTQIAPAQIATLSADQANAMTAAQLALLTPAQVAARATALTHIEAEADDVSRTAGPASVVPGLYARLTDGLINITNPGGPAGIGFASSFKGPPVPIAQNPGLVFTPPPSFSSTPSANGGASTKAATVDCVVRYATLAVEPSPEEAALIDATEAAAVAALAAANQAAKDAEAKAAADAAAEAAADASAQAAARSAAEAAAQAAASRAAADAAADAAAKAAADAAAKAAADAAAAAAGRGAGNSVTQAINTAINATNLINLNAPSASQPNAIKVSLCGGS